MGGELQPDVPVEGVEHVVRPGRRCVVGPSVERQADVVGERRGAQSHGLPRSRPWRVPTEVSVSTAATGEMWGEGQGVAIGSGHGDVRVDLFGRHGEPFDPHLDAVAAERPVLVRDDPELGRRGRERAIGRGGPAEGRVRVAAGSPSAQGHVVLLGVPGGSQEEAAGLDLVQSGRVGARAPLADSLESGLQSPALEGELDDDLLRAPDVGRIRRRHAVETGCDVTVGPRPQIE